MSHEMSDASQKPVWTPAKTFEEGGVVITVNVAEIKNFKRYSWIASFRRVNDQTGESWTTPYFAVFSRFNTNSYKMEVTSLADTFSKVVAQAEAWVTEQLQEQQERLLAERQDREQQRMAREAKFGSHGVTKHPDTIRHGKTERDKQKGKQDLR